MPQLTFFELDRYIAPVIPTPVAVRRQPGSACGYALSERNG